MKLKKLLLPIAGVASTAAIVAPVVTSCGMQTYSFTEDDFTEEFEPSKQATAKEIEYYQATEEYLTAVKDNKKILAEDTMFYLVNKMPSAYFADLDEIKISIGSINPTKGTISYKVDFVYKDSFIFEDEEMTSFEVKNMPYMVYVTYSTPNHWSFAPAYVALGNVDDATVWLMGYSGWSMSLSTKYMNNTMKWTVSPKDDIVKIGYVVEYLTNNISLFADSDAYLYYFDQITIKTPTVK